MRRTLRCDLLFRRATNARDRRAHGAGRKACRCFESRHSTGDVVDVCRSRCRHCGGNVCDACFDRHVVWRDAARSVDVCGRTGIAADRCFPCLLYPGATGDENRSFDRIALRISPIGPIRPMSTLIHDLRYGVRIFWKHPSFTLVAVITLALGIGANTAIFSLVNSILLQPLPFRDPDRLVRMLQSSPKLGLASWGVSQADYAAYREQNRSFESVAIYSATAANLTGAGEPERLPIATVTADFFKVFGVNPLLGRTFVEGEDTQGKNQICVISYAFWQRRFGGDPNVIGKTLSLNNTPTQIVGVMPAEFKFPRYEIDLWTPLAHDPKRIAPYFFALIGRLK